MPTEPQLTELIDEQEWIVFTAWFIRIEGPFDPKSISVKEAKAEFQAKAKEIYWAKVHPLFKDDVTSEVFLRFIRRQCRFRVQGGPFRCP
jgi:hypothetical protein